MNREVLRQQGLFDKTYENVFKVLVSNPFKSIWKTGREGGREGSHKCQSYNYLTVRPKDLTLLKMTKILGGGFTTLCNYFHGIPAIELSFLLQELTAASLMDLILLQAS